MQPDPALRDVTSSASIFAARRDASWFAANPRSVWRVRPMLEGESPSIDAKCALAPELRRYAIVIDHARAKDKRAAAGRAVYFAVCLPAPRAELAKSLKAEALRWVKWFRHNARTPEPAESTAILASRSAPE